MSRTLATGLFSLLLITALPVHAAAPSTDLTLSLIRAVRLSSTSITLSFKTNGSTIGQVTYAQLDKSSIQLTDSEPQVDHLFTITNLDPKHGYSFTLSARAGATHSNSYIVLLSPDTIGTPGQSIHPGVQVMGPDGTVVGTLLAASTTPQPVNPIIPWWGFAILFVVVVGGWIGYTQYRRRTTTTPPTTF